MSTQSLEVERAMFVENYKTLFKALENDRELSKDDELKQVVLTAYFCIFGIVLKMVRKNQGIADDLYNWLLDLGIHCKNHLYQQYCLY